MDNSELVAQYYDDWMADLEAFGHPEPRPEYEDTYLDEEE